jgi:hypothetical protein
VSTGTAPLYQSRGALEEPLQTRSASLRIYVKEIVTRAVLCPYHRNLELAKVGKDIIEEEAILGCEDALAGMTA